MKAHHWIALTLTCALACQSKKEAQQDETPAPAPDQTDVSDAAPVAPAPPARLELVDFPHTALGAAAGQKVFAPTDSSLASAATGDDNQRGRVSYVIAQVTEVGDTESKVKGLGSEWTVANALLVPIPETTEVAVGDTVVTSRHANDMTRAIITEIGKRPKANFMRIMPRGDNIAELVPGHYFRLAGEWQPGAPIAVPVGGRAELAMIVRLEGDRVLAVGHVGKLLAADRADIISLPLDPEVKKGNTVWGAWDSVHFMEGTVEKVEPKLGLVHIRFREPFDEDVKKIPYGEVTTELIE